MVKVQEGDGLEQVEEAIEQVTQILGSPIRRVADFYTYYYLTEIRGEEQFNFDHFKVTRNLQDSLYNYSIYAVSREAMNMEVMFNFDGKAIEDIAVEEGDVKHDLVDYIRKHAPEPELVRQMMIGPMRMTHNLRKTSNTREAKNVQKRYKAYTQSKIYLNALSFIFGHFGLAKSVASGPTRGEMPPTEDRKVKLYGWGSHYGGPAWQGVCESALEYHKLGKVAFVDLMLSVEHNNGNFLNKVDMRNQKAEELVKEAFSNPESETERMILDAATGKISAMHQDTYNTVIPNLLDAAKDERMLPLMKITATHDRNVSSWLRKNKETL